MIQPLPPLEALRAVFAIDKSGPTGLAWVASGKPAGSLTPKGYWRVRCKLGHFAVHRIVWSLANDELVPPTHEVDHINGMRGDNSPSNLRACTRSENAQNVECTSTAGTQWDAACKKWRAYVWLKGKRLWLGRHATREEAHVAYLKGKAEIHDFHPTPRRIIAK